VTHCHKGHTTKDMLAFRKQIDASVPRGLAVHIVLDNLSAHKAHEITRWLGHATEDGGSCTSPPH
jgi:hypothetical protein